MMVGGHIWHISLPLPPARQLAAAHSAGSPPRPTCLPPCGAAGPPPAGIRHTTAALRQVRRTAERCTATGPAQLVGRSALVLAAARRVCGCRDDASVQQMRCLCQKRRLPCPPESMPAPVRRGCATWAPKLASRPASKGLEQAWPEPQESLRWAGPLGAPACGTASGSSCWRAPFQLRTRV